MCSGRLMQNNGMCCDCRNQMRSFCHCMRCGRGTNIPQKKCIQCREEHRTIDRYHILYAFNVRALVWKKKVYRDSAYLWPLVKDWVRYLPKSMDADFFPVPESDNTACLLADALARALSGQYKSKSKNWQIGVGMVRWGQKDSIEHLDLKRPTQLWYFFAADSA